MSGATDDSKMKSRFAEILEVPVPFKDESEQEACSNVLQELSETEVEKVAQVSYAYWYLAKFAAPPSQETRSSSALREIRRHFVGEGCNHAKTLASIREALQYRNEYNVNEIRQSLAAESLSSSADVKNESKNPTIRDLVVEDLKHQTMVVRGYCKSGGAVAYKFSRQIPTADTNPRGFLLANLYLAERLMATTEYAMPSNEKTVVAFDFGDYESRYSPPTSIVLTFTKLLQRVYPERLQTLVVLNPPFWIRALYNLVYPFLSYDTREKLQVATGDEAIDKLFESLVDEDQAMPIIRKNGKLATDVHLDHYLYQVPFHMAYDDIPPQATTK